MPDFRNLKTRPINQPEIDSYEILRDKRGGFNVKLNWEYQNSKIVGFRIYKAILTTSLLRKNFIISQRALEKLTFAKSPKFNSQIFFVWKGAFFETPRTTANHCRESELSAIKTGPL